MESGWSIQKDGSNYLLGGSGHKWASLSNHSWTDYRVVFRLKLDSGTIHLNYRISENGRYFVGFSDWGLYITRQVNDNFTDLTNVEKYHSLGRWYTVEIAGWGGHIAVYVDGILEMQYEDRDYLRSGSIAFETLDNTSAQVDDIEVIGSGDEPSYSYQPPSSNGGEGSSEQPQPDSGSNGGSGAINPPPPQVVCTIQMTWEPSIDRPTMDYWNGWVGDPDTPPADKPYICRDLCLEDSYCQAFTYDYNTSVCWLKYGQPEQVRKALVVSGIKICQ